MDMTNVANSAAFQKSYKKANASIAILVDIYVEIFLLFLVNLFHTALEEINSKNRKGYFEYYYQYTKSANVGRQAENLVQKMSQYLLK